MQRRVWVVLVLATALACAAQALADAPTEATVTDVDGKDVKATGLKFGAGARRLGWLADPNGADDEAKKGPLALELREPHSTTYAKGVITYVPLAAVESIKYDYDKQVSAVQVKGLTEPLAGTLQYKGINVLNFDSSADGKAVKFVGGAFTKDHIKAVAFADPKPLPARKGLGQWQVQIDQPKAMDPTLKGGAAKFLLQFPGGVEALADSVPTRRGDPLKFDDGTKSLALVAYDPNTHVAVFDLIVGDTEKVVVVPQEVEKDGKKGVLVGVVVEVEAGWKVFPLHTIKGMKRPRKD
ncbi:MAG: hypothetical protein K2V38_13310 [Gemmataceae bacterium]|nr:hypothetical protein [Gemmataceae bacterium]